MTTLFFPLLIILCFGVVSAFLLSPRGWRSSLMPAFKAPGKRSPMMAAVAPKAVLLPDPVPNSIGNFFENKTEAMTFIQCYMISLGQINGVQYGVGFPVDMPVMLTYFEGNDLKPVHPDYPDYDHLLNHVAVQLEGNELQLYRTPVVLTLQGEFEDEDLNSPYPFVGSKKEEEEEEDYLEGDEEPEEITVDELIEMEGIDEDEDYDEDDDDEEGEEDDDDADDDEGDDAEDGDDDEFDDEAEDDEEEEGSDDSDDKDTNKDMASFWSSSPSGKIPDKYKNMPDLSMFRPQNPDLKGIPDDAIVTEEDARKLRKAHRRADRIIEYAKDISLIASFHHKKKNYHLVRLLEPIFIIGKRITDIKGYYFTLLDDKESVKVTPALEKLLTERTASQQLLQAAAREAEEGSGGGDAVTAARGVRGRGRQQSQQGSGTVASDDDGRAAMAAASALAAASGENNGSRQRRSRRRWIGRNKDKDQEEA